MMLELDALLNGGANETAPPELELDIEVGPTVTMAQFLADQAEAANIEQHFAEFGICEVMSFEQTRDLISALPESAATTVSNEIEFNLLPEDEVDELPPSDTHSDLDIDIVVESNLVSVPWAPHL